MGAGFTNDASYQGFYKPGQVVKPPPHLSTPQISPFISRCWTCTANSMSTISGRARLWVASLAPTQRRKSRSMARRSFASRWPEQRSGEVGVLLGRQAEDLVLLPRAVANNNIRKLSC